VSDLQPPPRASGDSPTPLSTLANYDYGQQLGSTGPVGEPHRGNVVHWIFPFAHFPPFSIIRTSLSDRQPKHPEKYDPRLPNVVIRRTIRGPVWSTTPSRNDLDRDQPGVMMVLDLNSAGSYQSLDSTIFSMLSGGSFLRSHDGPGLLQGSSVFRP